MPPTSVVTAVAASNSLTITKPPGTRIDDRLAGVLLCVGTGTPPALPTGWITGSIVNGTTFRNIFRKVDGTESSTFTFVGAGGTTAMLCILGTFSGISTASGTSFLSGGTGSVPNSPRLDAIIANDPAPFGPSGATYYTGIVGGWASILTTPTPLAPVSDQTFIQFAGNTISMAIVEQVAPGYPAAIATGAPTLPTGYVTLISPSTPTFGPSSTHNIMRRATAPTLPTESFGRAWAVGWT